MELIYRLFDTSDFITPDHYKGWTPVLLHISEWCNLLLFLVYVTIPVMLMIFVQIRGEQPIFARQRVIAFLFSLFIFSCGLTHLIRAITFHYPLYRLLCVVQIWTVLVSWVTVAVMIPLFLAAKAIQDEERSKFIAERMERIERIQYRLSLREEKLTQIMKELDKLPLIMDEEKNA